MPQSLQENLATLLVALALLALVILIIRKLIRDHKQGGACSCGCNCGACAGSCHPRQKKTEQKYCTNNKSENL